jgi:hypothetical protein
MSKNATPGKLQSSSSQKILCSKGNRKIKALKLAIEYRAFDLIRSLYDLPPTHPAVADLSEPLLPAEWEIVARR